MGTLKKRSDNYTKIAAAILFSSALFFFSVAAIRAYDLSLFFQQYSYYSLIFLIAGELVFRGIVQPRIGLRTTAVLYAIVFPLLIATSVPDYLLLCMFFLASGFWLGILRETEGIKANVAAICLYFFFVLATHASQYFPTVMLSAFLFIAPFYYLYSKGMEVSKALEELGITKQNAFINVLKGIGWTLLMFLVVMLIGISALLLGLNDQRKVAEKISSLPVYLLAFAVAVAPISEEIFFRGFLCKRAGVIASSALFALAHFSYGSLVELAATFFIGIVLAIQFKRSRSLLVPITAHFLFNLISISMMKISGF